MSDTQTELTLQDTEKKLGALTEQALTLLVQRDGVIRELQRIDGQLSKLTADRTELNKELSACYRKQSGNGKGKK